MQHHVVRIRSLRLTLSLAPILLLSGCKPIDWLKEKTGSSGSSSCTSCPNDRDAAFEEIQGAKPEDVLASMNGKSIVTTETFARDFDRLIEENPQLKSIIPIMPDAEFSFLNGMVSQKVVDRYIKEKGINKTPEYRKKYDRMMTSVESMLNTEFFGLEHPVQVSDADVQKFYEDNKDTMPDLLISRGGVSALGVSFKSEAEAQEFARKVRGKDFAKEAATIGKKEAVRDFKYVNSQSTGIDANVKNKIVGTKKFPSTEVVKATDNVYWVVRANGEEAPKYRPFEQVKLPLQQYLEKERRMEGINREIEKLRQEYQVVINEEYFKNKNNKAKVAQEVGEAQDIAPLQQAEGEAAEHIPAARAA